tara:strand:+ start:564 stop:830 length:267 start_codon:yes stop_codon:yes gene_type:complete
VLERQGACDCGRWAKRPGTNLIGDILKKQPGQSDWFICCISQSKSRTQKFQIVQKFSNCSKNSQKYMIDIQNAHTDMEHKWAKSEDER